MRAGGCRPHGKPYPTQNPALGSHPSFGFAPRVSFRLGKALWRSYAQLKKKPVHYLLFSLCKRFSCP